MQETLVEVPDRQVELSGRLNEKPGERTEKPGQYEVLNREATVLEQRTLVLESQIEVQRGRAVVPEKRSVSSERLVEVPEIQAQGLKLLSEASIQIFGAKKQNKETETNLKFDQKTHEVIFFKHFLFS